MEPKNSQHQSENPDQSNREQVGAARLEVNWLSNKKLATKYIFAQVIGNLAGALPNTSNEELFNRALSLAKYCASRFDEEFNDDVN